ncbi:MAG: radical SAM protein [Deltaproteobacteria bacterium]|nr:radical SAM protein [Deltaproteobacteria bacterium]
MSSDRFVVAREERCVHCGFCEHYVSCPTHGNGCIGCGICIKGCPQGARQLRPRSGSPSEIRCIIDGQARTITGALSVRDALFELGGTPETVGDEGRSDRARCDTGGCWNCAVLIDGVLCRSCATPLREGMDIVTDPDIVLRTEPRRIVTLMRPPPHYHPSVFVHGCNYDCDFCHNWEMTFASEGNALSPKDAVAMLRLNKERDYWVGISGGEPTLNRRWLLDTIREIRKTVPDSRIQLDTNASLLTNEYIDEIVQSGVSDISPDLKARRVDTFMKLCGIKSRETAKVFLETSWNAVRYLDERYREEVFMAVSLPYHPSIHSLDELADAARAIAEINPEMPVTLIEYQPAFRRRDEAFVESHMMETAKGVLLSAGLSRVVVQGGSEVPLATDPLELEIGSEEF